METEKSKVMNLPIFQNFDQSSIATQGKNALQKFRKGEWSIFTGLQLAAVGGVGYLSWVYVLPVVFQAIGLALATAATGLMVVAGIFLAPVAIKGLRRLTRSIHKAIIKYDPFGELEEQKQVMINNLEKTKKAKAQISTLKNDMLNESRLSEEKSKKLEKEILLSNDKAVRLKAEIDEMKRTGGKDATGSDEYIEKNASYMEILSQATRDGHVLDQTKNFVRKYGSRAQVMQKVDQKLKIAITVAGIKIKDFETTIDILKTDYAFAAKSHQATDAAKSAIGFTKGWELDYALDVVTSTIAADIEATSVNMNDINSLTQNFDLDSDDMFAKLDLLANNIKAGTDAIPEAKNYQNPSYKLTSEDKVASGGFGDMGFN